MLSPLPAVAGWLSILVCLNLTVHPVVAGAAFAGLAVVAWRAGRWRLLVASLLVGASLLVIVPGVARVDGSWTFLAGAPGNSLPPLEAGALALAAASVLRIPALVLAIVLVLLVPGELMLAAVAGRSPRSALLAGLLVRMGPLLTADARLTRDELANAGASLRSGVPVFERMRAAAAMWNAMLLAAFDRAFVTAATLRVRGFAAGPSVTREPLRDVRLQQARQVSASTDRVVLGLAMLLLAGVVAGRLTGQLAPPVITMFSGVGEPVTAWTVALAINAALIGVAASRAPTPQPRPAARARDAGAMGSPVGSSGPMSTAWAVRGPTARGITLHRVAMQYPAQRRAALVVDELQVEPGTFTLVVGASGSGKSTLLDVVSGVAPASTGGALHGSVRPGRAAAVFQDPERQVLVGQVAEEVAFAPRQQGLALEEVERRTLDQLQLLGCLGLARRPCSSLSGGELQRVLLAAALAGCDPVLVLDEPASQLDAAGEAAFWEVALAATRARGLTVVVAEHRLGRALVHADRVIAMAGGRIVADGPPDVVARLVPGLFADPFSGLVPATPEPGARARLVVESLTVRTPGGGRSIVRGLSMALAPGSVVSVGGPNGVGKSTLLRALRGLEPATGAVTVDGKLRGAPERSLRQVSLVSQQAAGLLHATTVREAAGCTLARLGMSRGRVDEQLASAGLLGVADSHPMDLSGGQRQRLAIVVAAAHGPAVLLLDEPTRGMDGQARRWLALRLLTHAAAGGVVVLATHDAALTDAVSSHRLWLDPAIGPRVVRTERSLPAAAPLAPRHLHGRRVEGAVGEVLQ